MKICRCRRAKSACLFSGERGAGLIMTAWVICGIAFIALIGLAAGGYVITGHRARAAADMAALAGAQAALRTGASEDEACAVAAQIALEQGGRADDCQMAAYNGLAALSVTVSVSVPWAVVGLPSELQAVAAAGNVDE
ncbi:MAG: hypothetical protein LBI84_06435 [Propionibacteriaceae bacterium]|jgi:secretion/DNA translocation related TadE-like protein|nr:hypothetical protein [Propionibacteriaceae bacterium]